MSGSRPHFEDSGEIKRAASEWLARRDRELTAAEQDEYLQWLRQNPRHGQTLARLQKTWRALDALSEWLPAHSTPPNPDLLALPPRVRRWRWPLTGLAAAALLALGIFAITTERAVEPISRGIRVLPRSERITLTDGSVVELNQDGKIETDFTPAERRVRLLRGEAHFTVTKNPARPFVVAAGAVSVRAVGTAFEVRRAAAAVEVLVTEGKVQVERPAAPAPTALVAGERAVVDTNAPPAAAPVITALTPAEIDHALAWQRVRLEFTAQPLAEVVAEFNLRNSTQIVIADADTAKRRVGGTFGADNVEGFVRLLQMSFGVTVERRSDGAVVLHRAK